MQVSSTYNYEKKDHINRANMALICSECFGIEDVSPSLYLIAAPVSELACTNQDGQKIYHRDEIEFAIPWRERSLKTFGVVYNYESTASFIGIDGRTYVVPNDTPVIEHLKKCGYVIAPYGKNLDGSTSETDSLIFKDEGNFVDKIIIDRNLPKEIVQKISEIENGRNYYTGRQAYAGLIRFGGSFGLLTASEEELQHLSLSERKIANISTYGRRYEFEDIEDYVQFALQNYFLNEENFKNIKRK